MAELAGRTMDQLLVEHSVDVDPRSGSAVLRVPVPASPGRQGIAPSLSLVYSGSTVNSEIGLGWCLSGLPTIGLSTRRHLPRWDGTDEYHLAGEELVPWLANQGGTWRARGRTDGPWSIAYFRSRRGGARTRVERWTHTATGRVHFRTRDSNNVLTVFGARPDAAGRLADPDDESRTFLWLPEVQLDPHGNALWFTYAPETLEGVDRAQPFEPSRPALAQRYLKSIRYGNVSPLVLDDALLAGALPPDLRWCFQLVVDYGDHSHDDPGTTPDRAWPVRLDPHTTCRPGFAVRTYRLCRRLLTFHHFDELGASPSLIGSLELVHTPDVSGSTVQQIGYTGFRRDSNVVTSRTIPPLRMTYAPAAAASSFVEAAASSAENVPTGVSDRYSFVDLFGEGLAGILTESERAWFYKPNLGGGEFGAQVMVMERPAIRPGTFAFGDIDGDGDTDLSQAAGRLAGSFALDRETGRWTGFRALAELPHVEALGGRAQWVDLNGDGRPDLVIAKPDALVWFPSSGDGFESPIEVPRPDRSAPSATADAELSIFFADMNGDGLTDLVRVQNGRVEYWPSLGNGSFGEVVVMDLAPQLARDEELDPARIRFVDLDGSGTADILYLGRGEVTCWINAAGNAFVPGPKLTSLPYLDNHASVSVSDFLGNGQTCLVWSSALPREHPIEYLPLTPETRPRLLLAVDNSLGRETRLAYSSSASHYLRDNASGRGWSTRLPHHVTVVDSVEAIDHIADTRSSQRFAYHDGYFDGDEREFRGFGQVDTYDADAIEPSVDPAAAAFAAPLLTRTWFHLGNAMWNHHRPTDTYGGDAALPVLAPHVVEDENALDPGDLDDGLHGLAGFPIRRETWAVDEHGNTPLHPFAVEQTTYRLLRAQPRRGSSPPAFTVVPVETLQATYEQIADDPRVTQELTLEIDECDLPRRTVAIAHARRAGKPRDTTAQDRYQLIATDHAVVHRDEDDRFELGIPIEGKRYELVGLRPGSDARFSRAQLRDAAVSAALANPSPHHLDPPDDPAIGPTARLLGWEQSFYWDDTRTYALALGDVGTRVLAHHEEAACFAAGLVADLYGSRVDAARLTSIGYVLRDGMWWQRDPRHDYTPATRFSQIASTTRADGAAVLLEYDTYELAVVATTDPLEHRTPKWIDYNLLVPWRVTDPNGTSAEVRRDPLGVVVASTSYGHTLDQPWGYAPLTSLVPRTPATMDDALNDPSTYLQGASGFVWYDLDAWLREGKPTSMISLSAESLGHDGNGGGSASGRIQMAVAYVDGFGRALQKKLRVDPGDAIQRGSDGHVIVDAGGRPVLAPSPERWGVSGGVVYDTKQRPGRTYEPYFSPTFAFENDEVLRHVGVSSLARYDALGRGAGVDFPNGTFATTTYAPWEIQIADPNDSVMTSAYRALREGRPVGDPERQAFEQAKAHANTTSSRYLDPAGRAVASLARGGATALDRRTEHQLDADGQLRSVVDPRSLVAFTYRRAMSGRTLYERSIDSGEVWSLPDPYGRTVLTWDSRGFEVARSYDVADRPLETHVRGGDGSTPLDHVVEQHLYGESLSSADAIRRNLLGREVTTRDGAGETTVGAYHPAGHAFTVSRRLRDDLTSEPDWRTSVSLGADTFTTTAVFDALGRTKRATLPDGTTIETDYLLAGPADRVRLTTPDGVIQNKAILDGTRYDARSRAEHLRLGNGIDLQLDYDPETTRLAQQTATLGTRTLQQIQSTYDPVGNIVRIIDLAQQGPASLIKGSTLPARRDYTHDAHYRLRTATGRVHQALLEHDYVPGTTLKATRHLSLNNGAALEQFTRSYDYDASGNLRFIKHAGKTRSWNTDLWISTTSNRSLPALDAGGNPIVDPESKFDGAGHASELSHLRQIAWSWRGTLSRCVVVERIGGTDDDEVYSYSADLQRKRKLATRVVQVGVIETIEKVYLGDQERKRIRRNGKVILERWTTRVGDGSRRLAVVHRWSRDDLAREVSDVSKPRIHYQLSTHQESSALELDELGRLISYEEYFPYGGTAFIAGDDDREVERKDYRYCGKERDDATSLYYYGYRYLAPWMGRWLSPDPQGPQDDLNLYQFVLGNPVTNRDLDGLETTRTPGSIHYTYVHGWKWDADQDQRIKNYHAWLVERGRTNAAAGFAALAQTASGRRAQERMVSSKSEVWLVPRDPSDQNGARGWAVIDGPEYHDKWLPARRAAAKARGHHVDISIPTDNPTRLRRSKSRDDAAPDAKARHAKPKPSSDVTGKAGKKDQAAQDGGKGGKQPPTDSGGGRSKPTSSEESKKDPGGGGGGVGPGPLGGVENGKVGGTGTDENDEYSNRFGGLRGGMKHGELGGTPFSTAVGSRSHGDSLESTVVGTGGGTGSPSHTGPSDTASGGSAEANGKRDGVDNSNGLGSRDARAGIGARPSLGGQQGKPNGAPTRAGGAQGGEFGIKGALLSVVGALFDWSSLESNPNGSPYGVPSGMGLLGLKGNSFWQWLHIITGVIGFVDMALGIPELIEGLFSLIGGIGRAIGWLFSKSWLALRYGVRAMLRSVGAAIDGLKAAYGGLRALFSTGKKYFSEGGGRGPFNHSMAEIVEALRNAAPAGLRDWLLHHIDKGLIKLLPLSEDLLHLGGQVSKNAPGILNINFTKAMHEVLEFAIHEAQHLKDIRSGLIDKMPTLVAEMRAFAASGEFAAKQTLKSSIAKIVGKESEAILESVLTGKSYQHLVPATREAYWGAIELFESLIGK